MRGWGTGGRVGGGFLMEIHSVWVSNWWPCSVGGSVGGMWGVFRGGMWVVW